MQTENQLHTLFIKNILRYLPEENFPRVIQCVGMLTEDQIWYRPNEQLNSVGNLVLHLVGNLRQWVLEGLGGIPYDRKRNEEFTAHHTKTKAELLQMLAALQKELDETINKVTAEELLKIRPVQVYEETGVAILIHVTEHFSYHTGQIAFLTKWLTNRQTGFYAGL